MLETYRKKATIAVLATLAASATTAGVVATAEPALAATTSCYSRFLDGGGIISGSYGDGLTVTVKNTNMFGVEIANVTAQPNYLYGGPIEEPQVGSANGVPIDLLPGQSASFSFSFGPSTNNKQDWQVTVEIPDGGDYSSVGVAVNLASTACYSTNPEVPDVDASGIMPRLHNAWTSLRSATTSFVNTTIGVLPNNWGVTVNYFYTTAATGGSWYNMTITGATGTTYWASTPGQSNWVEIGTQSPDGLFTPTSNALPATGPRSPGDSYGYGLPLPDGGQIGGYGQLGGDGGGSGDGVTGACVTVVCAL